MATILVVFCLVVVLARLCRQLPKWLCWLVVVVNGSAASLGTLGAYLFFTSVQEVLTLMDAESFVQDTSPNMTLSWAACLAFAGMLYEQPFRVIVYVSPSLHGGGSPFWC